MLFHRRTFFSEDVMTKGKLLHRTRRHTATCPKCKANADRLFRMIRAPHGEQERRACPTCMDELETNGWLRIARLETELRCGECHSLSTPSYVASKTGEPVEMMACAACAEPLKRNGWRAAAMYGTP